MRHSSAEAGPLAESREDGPDSSINHPMSHQPACSRKHYNTSVEYPLTD